MPVATKTKKKILCTRVQLSTSTCVSITRCSSPEVKKNITERTPACAWGGILLVYTKVLWCTDTYMQGAGRVPWVISILVRPLSYTLYSNTTSYKEDLGDDCSNFQHTALPRVKIWVKVAIPMSPRCTTSLQFCTQDYHTCRKSKRSASSRGYLLPIRRYAESLELLLRVTAVLKKNKKTKHVHLLVCTVVHVIPKYSKKKMWSPKSRTYRRREKKSSVYERVCYILYEEQG